jgi:hypothetical protein
MVILHDFKGEIELENCLKITFHSNNCPTLVNITLGHKTKGEHFFGIGKVHE